MTNQARVVRGIAGSAKCVYCLGSSEDTLHVLRECIKALEFWRRMVPSSHMSSFMCETNVKNWLEKNISSKVVVKGVKWGYWFSIICYQLWLARNHGIFQNSDTTSIVTISKSRAWLSWGDMCSYSTSILMAGV